ncbi:MAG: helix-turn-helix domain-containing protein [Acidimicrobiales bacterium]
MPRGHIETAGSALAGILDGAKIRRLRQAAGWSLAELGLRVGVTGGVVQAWEVGIRGVPRGRTVLLLASLAEAKATAALRHEALVQRIVEQVRSEPGVSKGKLLHDHRQRGGRVTQLGDYRGALEEVIRRRLIVTAPVVSSSYPHSRSGLYVPEAAPRRIATMTGDELGRERVRRELTQRDLARSCGVSVVTLVHWEQRRGAAVPDHAADRARIALAEAAEATRPSAGLREALLAAVGAEPGISTWRLRQRVGHGKAARRQLTLLKRAGELAPASAYDSLGRRYDGWYLVGHIPAPADSLSGAKLRKLRKEAGWTQPALAKALGMGSASVSRWESGDRTCPPRRLAEIRRILSGPPPLSPREERILTELEEAARAVGGALRTQLGWPRRRRFIELALELGRLRPETVDAPTRDGRMFRRELLFVADAPVPERPERPSMTAGEVKAFRVGTGLTQRSLGQLLGVGNMTVSGWETGRTAVPPRRVHQLRALADDARVDRQVDRQTGLPSLSPTNDRSLWAGP